MQIQSIAEITEIINPLKMSGKTIGLVPTMGFLHEGHLSLIKEARRKSDFVITSVFVNPLQFGAGEDFEKYPRDTESDIHKAVSAGSNAVFIPSAAELTPANIMFSINPGDMENRLCGAYRPGHFRGVCTIVLKLFQISQADRAFFGWKDAQQLILLKKMKKDFNLPIEIFGLETQRSPTGLALSSRNVYLTDIEKSVASQLYQSLRLAKEAFNSGAEKSQEIKDLMRNHLNQFGEIQIQYMEIVSQDTLKSLEKPVAGNTLIALAAFIGSTRLIDNIRL